MPLNAPIDGPPPSPETDPAAAKEAGRPAAQVAGLTAGQGQTGPMMGAGPDLSGIMALGMKIDEAVATMAQAVPLVAPEMEQIRALLTNALGKFSASGGTGSSPSAPLVNPAGAPSGPAPAPVAAAGAGFPGAISGNSRPY